MVAGCSVGACESGDAKVWSSSAECAPRLYVLLLDWTPLIIV